MRETSVWTSPAGIVTVVAVALPSVLGAQTAGRVCEDLAHREFDFWIGSWVIEQEIHAVDGSSERFEGRSDVRRAVDGCAIAEEWRGRVRFPWEGMTEPDSLYGLSVRSYDETAGAWRIHWMASRRPVFGTPFVGGFAAGVGTFTRRTAEVEGDSLLTRIVFDEVRAESVRWRLAVSVDGGETWRLLWTMRMRRARVSRLDPGVRLVPRSRRRRHSDGRSTALIGGEQ